MAFAGCLRCVEQHTRVNAQRFGNPGERAQCHVLPALLDAGDIGKRHLQPLGKSLLGEAHLSSDLGHPSPNPPE